MAYNPMMYNPYGQQQQIPQQAFTPRAQPTQGMIWVDGEMEAKGKPFPVGVMQFAMWDINEPVIYIKSLNPMGIPNPLRKIHYRMEEMQNTSQSGTANLMSGEEEKKDTTQYVKSDELQSMKEEIMQAIRDIKTEGTVKKTTAKGE